MKSVMMKMYLDMDIYLHTVQNISPELEVFPSFILGSVFQCFVISSSRLILTN